MRCGQPEKHPRASQLGGEQFHKAQTPEAWVLGQVSRDPAQASLKITAYLQAERDAAQESF